MQYFVSKHLISTVLLFVITKLSSNSFHIIFSKSHLPVVRAIRQQLLEANLPRIEPGPEAARLFLSDKELSTVGQKELARLHFELDKKRNDSKTQNLSEKDLFESEGKKPIQEMRRQVTIKKI